MLKKKSDCSQTYFSFFSKTGFSSKSHDCATDNFPLNSSDRAEIFTRDTLRYSPEVVLAIFVSDVSIRVYRVFKIKNLVLVKTFSYFFYKKKRK